MNLQYFLDHLMSTPHLQEQKCLNAHSLLLGLVLEAKGFLCQESPLLLVVSQSLLPLPSQQMEGGRAHGSTHEHACHPTRGTLSVQTAKVQNCL